MELRIRVAKNVRLRRLMAGLTQQQFAAKLSEITGRGWAQPQVSDVEHGRTAITLTTLEKIAQALDVPVSDLVQVPRARDVAKLGPRADLVTFVASPEAD
jgi:transcriptional regulator with XRE-family HTH domain